MIRTLLFWVFVCCAFVATGQKRFSEGTITFQVSTKLDDKTSAVEVRSVQSIKASHFRNEVIGNVGRTITIYDAREGSGAILREFGSQKIMTPLVRDNWIQMTSSFTNADFEITAVSKEIVGYSCRKAVSTLKDGSVLEVYFTDELVTDNPESSMQFKKLPGIALEYASLKGTVLVTYTAISVDFDPVPIQKFDIPASGYRILGFEESRMERK